MRYAIHLIPTKTHLLQDEFGGDWEYTNSYFEPRLPCAGCGSLDYAGWRCVESSEMRCNDCAVVRRPAKLARTQVRRG